ncbi:uncharacterized protein TNCT_602211 [Trichonephila clavata]|uniref:Uncharacterized protein n=1 Tax=Trichonephila clavata TaxID=2740835 RepID=A0A8X6KPF6_TRICU|nr:uncharacterized protein TNCT_602211 [Trichonephila clavata]
MPTNVRSSQESNERVRGFSRIVIRKPLDRSITMMKISKSSHKLHKSSRGSPVRKEGLKKSLHSGSSLRMPESSRPPSMKRLSPGLKHSPIMGPSKSMHSPRMRSISPPQRSLNRHSMQDSPVPIDRVRSLKRHKFDKRKLSPSPIRHDISSSHGVRAHSPYHEDRYVSPRSSVHGSHFSPPPMKKKIRREPDRFDHVESSRSDVMRHSDISMHDNRMPHRSEIPTHSSSMSSISHTRHHHAHITPSSSEDRRDRFEVHDRGHGGSSPNISSSLSKRISIKPSYDNQRVERYRSSSPVNRFASNSEKRYAPTLHERFSAVVESSRTEPKIKYSREELEKITIGIHRNLKAESPTLRRIVDPNDVKLVRRANEGHRPMFDREEIKQAQRDMREDAYYEKKGTSSGGAYNSSHSMDLRDIENYEITRHRFDPHHQTFHSSSGRSLSDRWQNSDGKKDGVASDRDDREYDRRLKRNYVDVRSKSGDRDFRSERYSGRETSRSRTDYPESQQRILSSPTEHRSVPVHRKENTHIDARKKLNMRRENDRELPPNIHPSTRRSYLPTEKRYSESLSRVDKHSDRRSPGMEPLKWSPKRRSPSRVEKVSEFSRRQDKYAYKSWSNDPDVPSHSSNYYEERSEGSDSYRGRGSSRPFRSSRGFRGRGYRGSFSTRSNYRGGYRNSSTFRGRGGSRRGRFSPNLWEHDLYSRTPEDRKMDLP